MNQHQVVGIALALAGLADIPLAFILGRKNKLMMPAMLFSAVVLMAGGAAFFFGYIG